MCHSFTTSAALRDPKRTTSRAPLAAGRAAALGHVVEVTCGIGDGEIDGGRHYTTLHRKSSDDELYGPAAPIKCPSMDFEALIGTWYARSANTFFMMTVSAASFFGCSVP